MILKKLVLFALVIQLSLFSPFQLAVAQSAPRPAESIEELLTGVDQSQVQKDSELAYWGQLDQNYPWLTEYALGEPITPGNQPLWTFEQGNPLLDQDPYFLRSQSWGTENLAQEACDEICGTYDDRGHVVIQLARAHRSLTLKRNFRILTATETYIVFASRDDEIFKEKVPGSQEPAQGLFFISKVDLYKHSESQNPVPVFHFPLPGDGWVGDEVSASDLSGLNQILVTDEGGDTLPIEIDDLVLLENTSRRNFIFTQVQTLLANQLEPSGIALPMPGSTAAFGLLPTGLGLKSKKYGSLNSLDAIRGYLDQFAMLPKAQADDQTSETKLDQMREALNHRLAAMEATNSSYLLAEQDQSTEPKGFLARNIPESLRSWIAPITMYGSTAGLAVYGAQQIEFGQLVTEDISTRILIISGLFAAAALASVGLRYTIYQDHFKKIHPPQEGETTLQTVDRHHRSLLTTYAHSLYFAETTPGQLIRQQLEFLKDRFLSKNQLVNKAWDETMGFQIRQSSALPVNWKMVYLGSIVHGMSDSMLVAVHLLIFTPWAMQVFGFGSELGMVAAAFATSEVIRNFIGYLKGGAHDYASDVKFIHLNRAEKEAARILISQGKDPDSSAHAEDKNKLVAEYLERIYASLGLPTSEEFLFDTVSVIKAVAKKNGFSLEGLPEATTQEDRQNLGQMHFHLSQRHWGKIVPSLKLALKSAQTAYAQAPTSEGLGVIKTLEWALRHHSFLTPGSVSDSAMKFAGLAGSGDLRQNLSDFIQLAKDQASQEQSSRADQVRERLSGLTLDEHITAAVMDKIDRHENLGFWGKMKATMVGTFRYLRQAEARATRDIRLTAFLMSTAGSVNDVIKFLPSSWIEQSGSQAAAGAAAELFHRSFSTILAGKDQGLEPDVELESQYGARAQAKMAEMVSDNPELSDAYLYRVRYWEVLRSIADADRSRYEALYYTPKEMTALEARQWQRARVAAEPHLTAVNLDSTIGRRWQSAAQSFATFIEQTDPDRTVDQTKWIQATRRRMVLVGEFARNIGLYLADIEASEVLEEVVQKASRDLDQELSQEKIKNYVARISESEAEFYEATLFYKHFISHYTQATSDSHELSANSPEFPGRLQRLRIKLAGKSWAKPLLFFTKIAESPFKNSADAYQAGLVSAITRNIPFASDLFGNFMNTLRIMPYAFSFAYLTTYYIWQVQMPYSMFVFMILFSFTHPVLVEWNNRLMRFFDIKPMDGVPEKLTYSFIHSNLTNPIVMFQLAFAGSIASILTNTNMLLGFGAAGSVYVGKLLLDQAREKKVEDEFKKKTAVVDGELVSVEKAPGSANELDCLKLAMPNR